MNRPRRDALYAVEHAVEVSAQTARDALHTLEDHDAAELRDDVAGLRDRLRDRLLALWQWSLAQPLYLRIVFGLTLLPLAALLALALKFSVPLLLSVALLLKLAIGAVKTLLFVGYIIYKLLKTLLMWYFTISRLYLGRKARRCREVAADNADFLIEPRAPLCFRCRGKYLYIDHAEHGRVRMLFSYLRYALRGQQALLRHIGNSWRRYLTLWRAGDRDAVAAELAPVGASMFAPHTLGPVVDGGDVLVPGDAELRAVRVVGADVALTLRVRWVDWKSTPRRTPPFATVRRDVVFDDWRVTASFVDEAR